MKDRTPAEVFPPGDFFREELEARGWTQKDLADILDQPTHLVSEIIDGKRRISPETALDLARGFGTSAEYWLKLESTYRQTPIPQPETEVSHGTDDVDPQLGKPAGYELSGLPVPKDSDIPHYNCDGGV